jgi:Ser/Thr protein kinase RdoA (MazF antagonist)
MALDRETFAAEELALCLNRYDLGEIRSIRPFNRGSPQAPKVLIESERGRFMFKRRPRGRDQREHVLFAHRLQFFLGERGFPLPHLVATRDRFESMLMVDGAIYELFQFVEGVEYDRSAAATAAAGQALGRFHQLTEGYAVPKAPVDWHYHDRPAVRGAIADSVRALGETAGEGHDDRTAPFKWIQGLYARCADAANELHLRSWPPQIIHGDWHPGNMLFDESGVAAVMDYDSARLAPRVLDIANGALQFSITAGSDDPRLWPSEVDLPRLAEFLRGYGSSGQTLSPVERQVLPHLMCEAMIAEAVGPIAATGTFGRLEGFPFLQMIARKAQWMMEHLKEMGEAIG